MKLTPEQLEDRRKTIAWNKIRKRKFDLAHAIINSGFAQQARRRHPDVGGPHEAMMELTEVRDQLRQAVGTAKSKSWWSMF